MNAVPVPAELEAVLAAVTEASFAAEFEPSPAMEHMLQLLGLRPGEFEKWLPSTQRDLARYVLCRRAAGMEPAASETEG